MTKKELQNSINMSLKGILSKSQLSNFKFIFPPLEKQKIFSDYAMNIYNTQLTIQESLNRLQTLKASLMQEYFS